MWGLNKKCDGPCGTRHAREAMFAVRTVGGSLLLCRKCKNTYYSDADQPKQRVGKKSKKGKKNG